MKMFRVGFILVAVATLAWFQFISAQEPTPRWTADLRTAGYLVDDLSSPGAYQANRQIAFGSNAEVVVANDANTSFEHPAPVTGFALDAASGQILSKATWR